MKINFIIRASLLLLLSCISAVAQTNLPTLRITTSNGVSTVFWPLTAYEGILQTTTDLSPAGTWTNLATGDQIVSVNTFPAIGGYAPDIAYVVGNEIAFSLLATNHQQFFRLKSPFIIPACCFAVFYNGVLEFSQSADIVVNGRVHANGPIYVGTSASQTFNAPVTTTSNLSAPFMDGLTSGWTPSDPSAWNADFNGTPGYITNAAYVGLPFPYSTNYHFLIDIPPADENPISTNGQLRLYNQAQIVLIVTNSPSGGTNPAVRLILQTSYNGQVPGADPYQDTTTFYYTNVTQGFLNSNLPFLSLTNKTYDRRETSTNLFTQIDVGKFATWTSTNVNVQSKLPKFSGIYPTILYVADRRPKTSTQLPAVRLVNGAQLPANGDLGFSVATPNPLYVWGNYNITTTSGTSTGTNNTYEVPAALLSDALTVLSLNWADSDGYTTYFKGSVFAAAATTINAAIVTGTVASTGTSATTFSGGVHNLPRLLEDWSGQDLYLNTSIVRLWGSQMATNQFRNPYGFISVPVNPYYNPPTRHFSFDPNFLNPAKIPPGIPIFEVIP